MKKIYDKLLDVLPFIWGMLLIALITAFGGVVLVLLIKLIIMLLGGM